MMHGTFVKPTWRINAYITLYEHIPLNIYLDYNLLRTIQDTIRGNRRLLLIVNCANMQMYHAL